MLAIIDAIHAILSDKKDASFFSQVKRIYEWDPRQVAQNDTPAIIIRPSPSTSSSYEKRGSQYNQVEHLIEVVVVYNMKQYYGSTKDEVVDTVIDMMKMCEWDWILANKRKSIIWILGENVCLNIDWQNVVQDIGPVSVNYNETTDRGFPSYEGVILLRAVKIEDR